MTEWIKVRSAVPGHRKMDALCRWLKVAPGYGMGILVRLWVHVLQHKPTGVVSGWSAEDLAWYAGYDGDPDKLREALITTGWLTYNDNGDLAVNDWDEHCYAAVQQTEKDKARERKRRERARKKEQAAEAADPPPERDVSQVSRDNVTVTGVTEATGVTTERKKEREKERSIKDNGGAAAVGVTSVTPAPVTPGPTTAMTLAAPVILQAAGVTAAATTAIATAQEFDATIQNLLGLAPLKTRFLADLRSLLPIGSDELQAALVEMQRIEGTHTGGLLISIIARRREQATAPVATRRRRNVKDDDLLSSLAYDAMTNGD